MKKIIFTPSFPVEEELYPQPAFKNVPQWYKETESFMNSKSFRVNDLSVNSTIKKCIPVFDAITAGYMLKTFTDVYVSKQDGLSYYSWPSKEAISFHPIEQAPKHPKKNDMPYPKWHNPWAIKTPKGYSTLFVDPLHNPNNIFSILPGIVDTDQYIAPVNFPFVLNDPNFEGIIPAGTIMAQVIPFKRDSYKFSIGRQKDLQDFEKFAFIYRNRWINNYKNKFWSKKQYR